MNIPRQVVGFVEITKEQILKERIRPNVSEWVIRRKITKAIQLSCGHVIPVTQFKKVPTIRTECHECGKKEDGK